jgi:starch phosphorylase
VLNCSVLDGWWVEGYSPDLGWAIGRGEDYTDPGYQDHVESQALYDILEKQIVPMFYRRGVDNMPREWIGRMKTCMRRLAPVFNTNRMVRDYAEKFYIPALTRGQALAENNLSRAIGLAHAKQELRHKWPNIRVVGVHTSGDGHFKVGEQMQVEALVDLPEINPNDVSVQLYAPNRHLFTGTIECRTSGRQGFAIRVLPGHVDMASPFEPGLITWN